VLAPFVAEFIGTFFLVASIGLNSLHGTTLAPFGIGLTLLVLVFSFGHISGAHFNPAVTLAVWLSRRRKISALDAGIYVVVQVTAAFIAGLFYWLIEEGTFVVKPGTHGDGRAFFLEMLWTFLLATVVLQTATTATQAGNSFFGLSIGFTVVAGAITAGPVSGGVFNPAVGIGVLVVNAISEGDGSDLKYLWLYTLGPLVGGLLAGVIFWFTNRREFHGEDYDGSPETHLYATDVQSIADVSAQKREGGKIIKGIIKKEITHLVGRRNSDYNSPDESEPMINNT